MDVWNYRGNGSWSFVALKRPGDPRLFCARNNTTNKVAYTRVVYRKKGAVWVEGNTPSADFILNPNEKPKFIPLIDVPTVLKKDEEVQSLFQPWYTLYFPSSEDHDLDEMVNGSCNLVTEGAMLFRKVSKDLARLDDDSRVIGIAVSSLNDATCISSLLDVDYYDTSRAADAA